MPNSPEKFIEWVTGFPMALRDAVNSTFGGTGPDSGIGLVPDPGPGATTNRYLNETGIWKQVQYSEIGGIPTPVVYSPFDNLIINPNAGVNQRGTGSGADDTYVGPDRFYNLSQTGAITASQGLLGADGIPIYHRINQDQAIAQRMGRCTILEDIYCNFLRGGPSTLSGSVRCSIATNIKVAVVEWISTANVVTSDLVNDWTSPIYTAGNFFIGGGVLGQISVGTITVAANTWTEIAALITAIHSSTLNNIYVFVWTESTVAQNVTLDFVLKLEQNNAASEFLVPVFETEYLKCKRYLQSITGVTGTGFFMMGGFETASRLNIFMEFPVNLRVGGTVVSTAGNTFVARAIAGGILSTCSNINGAFTPNSTFMDCNAGASPFTAGQFGALQQQSGQTAQFFFPAEL